MSEALITWLAITLMARRLTRASNRHAERRGTAHGGVVPQAV
ncbi:hypothetical protein [Streptomyces sp. NPDC051561]